MCVNEQGGIIFLLFLNVAFPVKRLTRPPASHFNFSSPLVQCNVLCCQATEIHPHACMYVYGEFIQLEE